MIGVLVTILLLAALPCVVTAGESAGAAAGLQTKKEPDSSFPRWVSDSCTTAFPGCQDGPERPSYGSLDDQTVLRGGWWTTDVTGSPAMIGEYQDLDSSPFWELDHLSTDGVRSNDVSFIGTDNETTQARWDYAGPGFRANVEYDRFIHALSPDPLTNFPQPVADPANPGNYLPVAGEFIAEDLNAGEDYAIRVQQLKAKFQGDLTDKIRWRLNVWGLRKEGERQVTALADCFDHQQIAGDTRQCHVLGRRQRIDWLTTELEPGLEGKWGAVTVSYSRPMRSFRSHTRVVTSCRKVSAPPAPSISSVPKRSIECSTPERRCVSPDCALATAARLSQMNTRSETPIQRENFWSWELRKPRPQLTSSWVPRKSRTPNIRVPSGLAPSWVRVMSNPRAAHCLERVRATQACGRGVCRGPMG